MVKSGANNALDSEHETRSEMGRGSGENEKKLRGASEIVVIWQTHACVIYIRIFVCRGVCVSRIVCAEHKSCEKWKNDKFCVALPSGFGHVLRATHLQASEMMAAKRIGVRGGLVLLKEVQANNGEGNRTNNKV